MVYGESSKSGCGKDIARVKSHLRGRRLRNGLRGWFSGWYYSGAESVASTEGPGRHSVGIECVLLNGIHPLRLRAMDARMP